MSEHSFEGMWAAFRCLCTMRAARSLAPGVAVLAAAAAVATARAEDAPQPSGATVEEVVVTAQRRAERLQDVPIAVSAVTSDRLESMGVNGIADQSVAVPSLNVANGNGYLITHLRG